jgi:hypothetical protein
MIEAREVNSRPLGVRKSHGRVVNAISSMLRQKLSVPNIYLRPRIPGYTGIDVMAVDRGGSGDVHGVQIRFEDVLLPSKVDLRRLLSPLHEMPVHFRYLAFLSMLPDISVLQKLSDYEELFDKDGIGRYGIIAFDANLLHRESSVETGSAVIVVKPERFLVRGEKLSALDKYLAKARPDIEVRM